MNTDLFSKIISEQIKNSLDSSLNEYSKQICDGLKSSGISPESLSIVFKDLIANSSIMSINVTLKILDQLHVLPDIPEDELRKMLFHLQ